MAKKRDSDGVELGGTSFAGKRETTAYSSEGDIEAWGDDEKTAPDIFADASAEDRMQAGDGHTPRPNEEHTGRRSRPNVQRR
jgi:hypothetical protein